MDKFTLVILIILFIFMFGFIIYETKEFAKRYNYLKKKDKN